MGIIRIPPKIAWVLKKASIVERGGGCRGLVFRLRVPEIRKFTRKDSFETCLDDPAT